MEVAVAKYLKQRLEEQGLGRLFGIAGTYSAPFLDTIGEDASERPWRAASMLKIWPGIPRKLLLE